MVSLYQHKELRRYRNNNPRRSRGAGLPSVPPIEADGARSSARWRGWHVMEEVGSHERRSAAQTDRCTISSPSNPSVRTTYPVAARQGGRSGAPSHPIRVCACAAPDFGPILACSTSHSASRLQTRVSGGNLSTSVAEGPAGTSATAELRDRAGAEGLGRPARSSCCWEYRRHLKRARRRVRGCAAPA